MGVRRVSAALGVCAMLPALASAFIPSIDAADADRALRIARSSRADRIGFSDSYRIDVIAPTVDRATLEQIDITTEFRRMERIAEERLAVDPTFGGGGTDEMLEAIRPWRNQLAIVARVRLGSALLGATPPPTITLIDDQAPLSVAVRTLGNREGPPTAEEVESTFDSTRITSGVHTITVKCGGVEVARREVDFRRFE